jgi:formylmethanofuran dehydrogenase subunit E
MPRAVRVGGGRVHVAIALVACGPKETVTPRPPATLIVDPIEEKLEEITRVHGAAGPWVVLGYRMSEHALAKLGVARGSPDVEIVHWSPREIDYASIADGAAAHSGASVGKLNLSLVEATADNVLTVVRDKKSGQAVALRPVASFKEQLGGATGRDVMVAPEELLFEEVSVAR